jgi:hypothetical protein
MTVRLGRATNRIESWRGGRSARFAARSQAGSQMGARGRRHLHPARAVTARTGDYDRHDHETDPHHEPLGQQDVVRSGFVIPDRQTLETTMNNTALRARRV